MSSLRIATQVLAGVFGGNEEISSDDVPRDEEFLATVLMMFKREVDPLHMTHEWTRSADDMDPQEDDNSGLDGEAGSSSLEEETSRRKIRPKRNPKKWVNGVEMVWNASMERYCLVKPKSTQGYHPIIRWSLEQLPFRCGTAGDVFAGVKEFGWPELKNTRESLSCKKTIAKVLLEGFVEKEVNERGESVYCWVEEGLGGEVLTEQDSLTRTTPTKRRREQSEGKRVERRAKREVRRKPASLVSEEAAEEAWWEEEAGSDASPRKNSGGKKQAGSVAALTGKDNNNGRGRRWVRFACEKHRREHARCPDNCAMRKKSYVDDEQGNDMDIESCDLQGESAEGVVADDGAMD